MILHGPPGAYPGLCTYSITTMSLFKVNYRDAAPSGDVIGRGILIDADCLEDAEARACLLESVRQFWPREVA